MRLIYILIVTSAIVVSATSIIFPIHPDEKVFLAIANHMNNGGLPYLDYFDNKPPGIYFIAFFVTSFFGNNFWGIRLLVLMANLIIASLMFLLGQKWFSKNVSIFSALAYLILAPIYQGNFFLTEVFMNVFNLASILMLARYTFVSAILASIATIFKQSAIINLIINYLFLLRLTDKKYLKTSFYYWFGALIPWIILIIYFISHNILSQALWQIFYYNLFFYRPWPIRQTVLTLPKVIYPAIMVWITFGYIIINKRIKSWQDKFLVVSVISVFPILLTRPYHHYWLQILPFVILLVFAKTNSQKLWWFIIFNLFIASIIFIGYGFLFVLPAI